MNDIGIPATIPTAILAAIGSYITMTLAVPALDY